MIHDNTWATGLNYVEYPYPPPAVTDKYRRPNSFKELVQQCTLASVTLLYDDKKTTAAEKVNVTLRSIFD